MKWIKQISRYWKTIQLALTYLAAILAVYFMFPREGKFSYEFTKNKPWMYEDLIAPFDIPIYKTEQQIQHERDSLLKKTNLYFLKDTVIGREMISSFGSEYSGLVSSIGLGAYISNTWNYTGELIEQILSEIYERGIIENHPVLDNEDKENLKIMVVNRTIAEQKTYSELFTLRSAYDYLMTELKKLSPASTEVVGRLSLADYLRPNIIYDEHTTNRVKSARMEEVSLTQGMVQSGQRIISRGELVSGRSYQLLESLRKEYETNPNIKKNYFLVYSGQLFLIALIILSLLWFLYNYRKDIMASWTQTFFILSLIVIMVGITLSAVRNDVISVYVIPFVVVPIFLKTFFDDRVAIFVHILTVILAALWVPNSYQFVLLNFLAGLVGVFAMRSFYRRGILFYTAIFVILTYISVYLVFSFLQEGNLSSVNWLNLLWFGGNGLLILTVYPLVFLFERVFGFLSDATLFELSDTNQPLLRMLAEKTPGTFQHSMQVANLAEEAVLRVGGNSLLVRTGALYHDIGKMDNPQYFIENQRNGENPHDKIDFQTSARIIIGHVLKGVEIARKHRLPDKIVDFIRTHHGTGTVQYFYRSFINQNPGKDIDINEFTYPGPKPYSKETAILMIADSIEAASRAMKNINQDTINELVDNIIANQTREQQYSDSNLTFKDIEIIRELFKNRLSNIYHARIEYPE
ncbi:MAG: HDIG domain-containing protein [Bacteroidales bacterium]|nr:HDIG domain-containing protein [Bacteroidales bacterium]MBN2698460.1 HDIG domain-containing protein [Bacteroidales bacterium]